MICGMSLNSPNINSVGFQPYCYHSIVNPKKFKQMWSNNSDLIDITKNYCNGYGLNLKSSYAMNDKYGKEPLFTTYKERIHGIECHTIDYILYQPKYYKVTKILNIPNKIILIKKHYYHLGIIHLIIFPLLLNLY